MALTHYLKQSTAVSVLLGPFLDETDGKTPETGLNAAATDLDFYKGVTKSDITDTDSGGSNDFAHVANGNYSLELTTSDTDTLGAFAITCNATGALPVRHDFVILPANVYDSLIAGSDNLQVDTVQGAGTAWNSGAIGPNTLASDTITAAKIATDAIGTDELAATAVNEIAGAVGGIDMTGVFTADALAQYIIEVRARLGTPSNLGSGATVAANLVDIEGQASGALYGEDGSITFTYTVFDTNGTTPLSGVSVYVSADIAGTQRSQAKITDALGQVQFALNPGTVYFWRERHDRTFTDPDTETVS